MSISPWPNWKDRPLATDGIVSSQDLIRDNFMEIGSVFAQILPGLTTMTAADYLGPASQAGIFDIGSTGDAPSHAIGNVVRNGFEKKWNAAQTRFDTIADWVATGVGGTILTPPTLSCEIGSSGERLQKAWLTALDADTINVSTLTGTLVTPDGLTATLATITTASIANLNANLNANLATISVASIANLDANLATILGGAATFANLTANLATISVASIANLNANLATIPVASIANLNANLATITVASIAELNANVATIPLLSASALTVTQVTAAATIQAGVFTLATQPPYLPLINMGTATTDAAGLATVTHGLGAASVAIISTRFGTLNEYNVTGDTGGGYMDYRTQWAVDNGDGTFTEHTSTGTQQFRWWAMALGAS